MGQTKSTLKTKGPEGPKGQVRGKTGLQEHFEAMIAQGRGPHARRMRRLANRAVVYEPNVLTRLGTPSISSNIPPTEAHDYAFTTPGSGGLSALLVNPIPPSFGLQTQYTTTSSTQAGWKGSAQAAYNTNGPSAGLFLDAFIAPLSSPMTGFVPHKIDFIPMQPFVVQGKIDFDWKLVAIGTGIYTPPQNQSSVGATQSPDYVTTALAMDPYTGQLKANPLDPNTGQPSSAASGTVNYVSGVNMLRYTIPYSNQTNSVSTATINPAGMVYHPAFGLMCYGPVISTSTQVNGQPRNPFVQDPGNGSRVLSGKVPSQTATSYGTFVPDMSGVSFGNKPQMSPWILAPSCDWDMMNMPGYKSLIDSIQANTDLSRSQIAKNFCQFKVSDFVQSACLQLSNGTMFVDTYPEVGTLASEQPYGIVACGFTSGSMNTGLGLPDGSSTFSMFVNLYYYFDPMATTQPNPDSSQPPIPVGPWPDPCSGRPVTSGWMMPRNVNASCADLKQTTVSGSSYQCPQPFAPIASPSAMGGPYPAMGNSAKQGSAPCLCPTCGIQNASQTVGILPCQYVTEFVDDAFGVNALDASTGTAVNIGAPFVGAVTYPDDPTHVSYTESSCAGNVDNANTLIDTTFGSYVQQLTSQTTIESNGTNWNQGGQFITWFDTVANAAAVPVAMQVVQGTIFIMAMEDGASGQVPVLFRLRVVDTSASLKSTAPVAPSPTNVIGPTTTIRLMSRTYLNPLVQSYDSNTIGDTSKVSIVSVQQMKVLDFTGSADTGGTNIMLLCTLANNSATTAGSYPDPGPSDDNTASGFNKGPAIITFQTDLVSTDDPWIIDLDLLNAHSNQNSNAGKQATNNPLVRGMVKTNNGVPTIGVVSEACNAGLGGSSYCKSNPATDATGRNVCDQINQTVGDPMQKELWITSISPPTQIIPKASGGGPSVTSASSQPTQLTWDTTTNAALLSHVKMYLEAKNLINISIDSKLVSMPEQTYKPQTQVWVWDPVNPSTNTDQLFIKRSNRLILYANQTQALGVINPTTMQLGLVGLGQGAIEWFQTPDGKLQDVKSQLYMTATSDDNGSSIILSSTGSQCSYVTQGSVSGYGLVAGGITNQAVQPSSNQIVFADLPSMQMQTTINNSDAQSQLQMQTVPMMNGMLAEDLRLGLQVQPQQYTGFDKLPRSFIGWNQDLANRFRSQFRGQTIRHNAQGPVTQVLSFFTHNMLLSANTDPYIIWAASPFTALSGNNQLTSQFVIGYVLTWMTMNEPFSTDSSDVNGTSQLVASQITPIWGPLMSMAPNNIVHWPSTHDGGSGLFYSDTASTPISGFWGGGALTNMTGQLDPTWLYQGDNGNSGESKLNFTYSQQTSNAITYYDQSSKSYPSLPRLMHPISGLTSCGYSTSSAPTAADTGEYEGLKWIAQYVATDPAASTLLTDSSNQGIVGYRSMMGLQPGNLNIIGPMAFGSYKDQNLVNFHGSKFDSQLYMGNQSQPNINGFYYPQVVVPNNYNMSSAVQARCAPTQ